MSKENDKRIYQMSLFDMSMAMADATRNHYINVKKERGVVISETDVITEIDYVQALMYSAQIMREFEKEIERFRIDKEEGELNAKH